MEKKTAPKEKAGTSKKKLSENELVELLNPSRGLKLEIVKQLKEFPEKYLVLLVENVQNYRAITNELMGYYAKKGIGGVFVSVNKPIKDLAADFEKNGIGYEKVIFIDSVTYLSSAQMEKRPNFLYLDSPKNLTELTVMIEESLGKVKSKSKFVIVDSLSTLIVYNKKEAIEKFFHSLSGNLREKNVKGVFFVTEATDKETIDTMAQFCDKVIRL